MSQHIGVKIVNESGIVVAEAEINFSSIHGELSKLDKNEYPILLGIDEYGDTYFNYKQSNGLVNELEKLKIDLPKYAEDINKIISLIQKISIHSLLKFIGD